MKVLLAITFLIVVVVLSIALLNLLTLFDEGRCECSPCSGACMPAGTQPVCDQRLSQGDSCINFNCKELSGKCRRIPKILDFSTYLRGS